MPVLDAEGQVTYLIEMLTDITETVQMRREYQLLFDQVPCSVLIIDRNYRILRTNQTLQKMLGDLEGGYCYNGVHRQADLCNRPDEHRAPCLENERRQNRAPARYHRPGDARE